MEDNLSVRNVLEIIGELSKNRLFLFFIVALTLFTLLTFFIKSRIYGYAILTLYIVLGLFIFILASSKRVQMSEFIAQTRPTMAYIYLSILFINLTFSNVYLIFFESLYSKSLYYYFFIGVCSLAIFITSVSVEDNSIKKLLPYFTFLFGLNILLSNFIVFPNGVYSSGDTHYQIYTILLPTVENGHVPRGFTYTFFPIHQILIASLAKITNIDPMFLYLTMISLLYVVSGLFIYSLIRHIADSRFGITAMLLFIMSPSIFYHGTHAYQFTYALPFAILLMFTTTLLTISHDCNKDHNFLQSRVSWTILQILFIWVIIWTHQFTSTMTFVLISISCIMHYIISKNNNNTLSFYYSLLFLYIVMLFAHWIYVSSVFKSLIMVLDVYYNSLFSIENYMAASSSLSSDNRFLRPWWLILLDMSGRGILMMLGSVGSLYGIWKKNKYVFVWLIIGAFIWILISIGSFIDMPLLLGDRMFAVFEAMSLVYLATFGVMLLIERFGTKGLIFCSMLFFILPTFSLGSTMSGSDTSLFIGNQPHIKFYDTYSDLQYRAWIKNTVPYNSNIWVSESWVLQYLDTLRIYNQLPIDDHDNLVDDTLKSGEYLILNKHDSIGLRVRGISEEKQIELVKTENISTIEAQARQMRTTKLDTSEIKRVTMKLKHIYSNGETNICLE